VCSETNIVGLCRKVLTDPTIYLRILYMPCRTVQYRRCIHDHVHRTASHGAVSGCISSSNNYPPIYLLLLLREPPQWNTKNIRIGRGRCWGFVVSSIPSSSITILSSQSLSLKSPRITGMYRRWNLLGHPAAEQAMAWCPAYSNSTPADPLFGSTNPLHNRYAERASL
jgi:hypothetical protein